jgi:hypothetical protein
MAEQKQLSRSEREAQIKDKAGWVIVVMAALLAINTYLGNGNSSRILNDTIEANNTWAFYQAKSIKGTLAEMALDDAMARKDVNKVTALSKKIARYESDPATGEGKKELMAKARGLKQIVQWPSNVALGTHTQAVCCRLPLFYSLPVYSA